MIEKRKVVGVESTAVAKYAYDVFNQMLLASTQSETVRNGYNAFGQRISKISTSAGRTEYLLDGSRAALEMRESGVTAYFYGNTLISRKCGGEAYYYHYNAHGDVRTLTDADGETKASYRYDAFGALLSKTGDAENHITYAGYQYDEETGLYYLNARMYDPVSMRFLQYDTYGGRTTDALSLNRYAYGQGNPVRYYDPTGHSVEEVWQEVMRHVQGSIFGQMGIFCMNFASSFGKASVETTLKVGAYEAKDLVTSYVIAKTSAVLIATGAAVTIASAGTLSFGGVMLAGLGMGMVGAGVSVRMQAYTEWETQNGITGSFGSYLTTAGLGFATGFVSGAVSSITGGIAGNLAAKAFASKTMSAAAKYAVKYGVNFGLETVGDAGIQYLTTGEVDWKRALQSGAINTGILGAADGIHAVAMNWKQIKAGVKNFIGDELGAVDISRFKSGKETELFLPDEFYNKNLPSQVTSGTKYLPKYDEVGNVKQIKMYDDYGREIGWVDYTNHGYGNVNSPHYHTTPHWHEKTYNAQYPDGLKTNHRTDINTPLGDK